MAKTHYDDFIRSRITELRIAKNISEHKMSLDVNANIYLSHFPAK